MAAEDMAKCHVINAPRLEQMLSDLNPLWHIIHGHDFIKKLDAIFFN